MRGIYELLIRASAGACTRRVPSLRSQSGTFGFLGLETTGSTFGAGLYRRLRRLRLRFSSCTAQETGTHGGMLAQTTTALDTSISAQYRFQQ